MQIIRTHIIGKVLVILLSMFLLAPIVVKLNHIFEDHKHEVCNNSKQITFS